MKSNNGELLGAYGNLVNRTLIFAKKYFNGAIPQGTIDENINFRIKELYNVIGSNIEKGNLKNALEDIFEFIRSINKYFDEETPWITINSDKEECEETIFNCIYAINNISNLLEPFLPASSQKVKSWLGVENNKWELSEVKAGYAIGEVEILFERLDQK